MGSSSYPPNPLPGVATKIVLTPQSADLPLGQSLQLEVSLFDAYGTSLAVVGSKLLFKSSNPSLASVNSTGLVTAAASVFGPLPKGGQVSIAVTYPYNFGDAIEADCVLQITVPAAYSGTVVKLEKNATVASFGEVGLFANVPWDGGNPVIGG
jgi:hypothetical protein